MSKKKGLTLYEKRVLRLRELVLSHQKSEKVKETPKTEDGGKDGS